jgi:hypothetical protein
MAFASSLQFSANFRSRSAAISMYMENNASDPSVKSVIACDAEFRFWPFGAGRGGYCEAPEGIFSISGDIVNGSYRRKRGAVFQTCHLSKIYLYPNITAHGPAHHIEDQTPSRVVAPCKRLSIRHILSHTHLPFSSKLCVSLHSAMTGDTCVGDLGV